MVDAHEFIVGFPKAWTPFAWPQVIQEQIWEVRVLAAICSFAGLTIHDIVNSEWTRRLVQILYKGWKEIQRGQVHKEQEAYDAWLAWCRDLGCPV